VRYFTSMVGAVLCVALLAAPGVQGVSQQPGSTPEVRAASSAVININAASIEQLDKLPGIGPKTAAKIVEYRQKNGAFKKIEELMNVKGIGEKAFLRLKSQIAVASPVASVPAR
jgi:competence protein ComEA